MVPVSGTLALGSGYRGMSSEELFDVLAQRQAIPRAQTQIWPGRYHFWQATTQRLSRPRLFMSMVD
jgi:hypothetical protein